MYKQITANKEKSWLLILLFVGVLAMAGYAYGFLTDTGYSGLMFALVISLSVTVFSWFAGDKVVLATSGAQEIKTREQNPYVWNMVENLCITSGLPLPRIYIIDDPAMNAFATGRDPKHASVAVTSGLIGALENEELEGVIGHELSHIKNFDTRLLLLVAVLVGSLTLLGDFFFRGSLFRRGRRDRSDSSGILMLLGIVFLLLAPLIGQLIKLAISRKREFLADADSALLTRYPEGLARALEKIHGHSQPARASQATAHLWISNPFGADSGVGSSLANLFSTHPPIATRVQELRNMEHAL